MPADRVAQIHIAGHSKFEKYILDTHDHPVIDPVWKLYAHAIRASGPTATLLEWDDQIPSFEEVHAEALKAEQFIRMPCSAPGPEEPRGKCMNSARYPAPMAAESCVRLRRAITMSRRSVGSRSIIKPNDRLTGRERLEIYSRQYWFRVLDSLVRRFSRAARDHSAKQVP